MPLHPAYVERFSMLEGIESFEQLISDPVLEQRFHEFMQWHEAAPPPPVASQDREIPGPHGPVPVRVYRPHGVTSPAPCLVWMHGGAFMRGDLDMPEADRTSREVCARAGAVVVSVDYRLAIGGVHYPVPLDDVVAAIRWVRDSGALDVDPARLAVGGASAGATLATGAVLRLRDEDDWQPAALIPVYGMFHPTVPPASADDEALMIGVPELLRFTPEGTAGITAAYLGGPAESADGYAMPILADLHGLCPTLLIDAEYDDLRRSADLFAEALAQAGVPLTRHLAPGTMHGLANLPAEIEPVGRVFALMSARVAEPTPVSSR